MTDERYCTECGYHLNPADRFCPACGATVRECEDYVAPVADAPGTSNVVRPTSDRAGKITVLALIWGILALVFGASILLQLDTMVDTFVQSAISIDMGNGQNMWEYLVDNGVGTDEIRLIYLLNGGAFALSGFFALVSAHFVHRRQSHSTAFIFMLLSALFAFMGLLSLIIGLIVTYYLYKSKDEFKS